MKRKIPYGVMNWEKAVRECYLVDNTPEGCCDFLAVPKPGFAKPACLVEFKYFTNAAAARGNVLGRATRCRAARAGTIPSRRTSSRSAATGVTTGSPYSLALRIVSSDNKLLG